MASISNSIAGWTDYWFGPLVPLLILPVMEEAILVVSHTGHGNGLYLEF